MNGGFSKFIPGIWHLLLRLNLDGSQRSMSNEQLDVLIEADPSQTPREIAVMMGVNQALSPTRHLSRVSSLKTPELSHPPDN